jgi:hypothetical protein
LGSLFLRASENEWTINFLWEKFLLRAAKRINNEVTAKFSEEKVYEDLINIQRGL